LHKINFFSRRLFEQQKAKIILTRVSVIIEKTGLFPVLSTHGQSKRNNNEPKLQKIAWRISASTVNENPNTAWRSIIAVAITGYFGMDFLNSKLAE
jgi:hypothetical protein